MAGPNSATTVSVLLERDLSDTMVKTCEAEQRSKLIVTCLRLKLLLRDVRSQVVNQLSQQRSLGPKGNGGDTIFKTGQQRMLSKLTDCRKDGEKLRRERNSLRKDLECMVNKNVYQSIMKKLKLKMQRLKVIIRERRTQQA